LRLLLDTHIFLESAAETEKLSQNITNELEPDNLQSRKFGVDKQGNMRSMN